VVIVLDIPTGQEYIIYCCRQMTDMVQPIIDNESISQLLVDELLNDYEQYIATGVSTNDAVRMTLSDNPFVKIVRAICMSEQKKEMSSLSDKPDEKQPLKTLLYLVK
jgi:hypothetical protein